MIRILLVADVPWVVNDLRASLGTHDYELMETSDPVSAAAAALDHDVDAVVVDLQVASMGGMAVARDVRSLHGMAGEEPPPVVMLLDRAADGFLAKRAGAAGWVAKPFTSHELRGTIARALTGPTAVADPSVESDTGEGHVADEVEAVEPG